MFNRFKFTVAALAASALVSGISVYSAPAWAVSEPQHLELQDGTKIVIEGDTVSVENADGTTTPAPDGDHVTKDGRTITTKDGMVVAE